ncbi:MAG: hypothetical protein H0W23_02795 [Chloroflexia bacterium]|nr:hypothetical protein [Chloroflexia bacterium]
MKDNDGDTPDPEVPPQVPMQAPPLIDEIEHGSAEYTDDELFEQAAFNAQALVLGTVQTLSTVEGGLDRWRVGIADVFARGWDLTRPWRAAEILDALLTNYRAFGADIIEVDLSTQLPTALISGLPDLELAATLELDPGHIGELFAVGGLIVQRLGGTLAWEIDEETGDVRLSVTTVS